MSLERKKRITATISAYLVGTSPNHYIQASGSWTGIGGAHGVVSIPPGVAAVLVQETPFNTVLPIGIPTGGMVGVSLAVYKDGVLVATASTTAT